MSVLRYRRWVLSTGDLPGWVNSRTGLLTGVSQRLAEVLRSRYRFGQAHYPALAWS
jgi:hypothetical protein